MVKMQDFLAHRHRHHYEGNCLDVFFFSDRSVSVCKLKKVLMMDDVHSSHLRSGENKFMNECGSVGALHICGEAGKYLVTPSGTRKFYNSPLEYSMNTSRLLSNPN